MTSFVIIAYVNIRTSQVFSYFLEYPAVQFVKLRWM